MKQHPYSPKHIIHCEDTGETVSGNKYLSSKHWKQLRAEVYNYYNGICQKCGDPVPLSEADIHHRVYKRMGKETLTDMVLYCTHCHACIHSSKKKNHQTNKDLQTLIQSLTASEKEEAYRLLVEHFKLSDIRLDEDKNHRNGYPKNESGIKT